MSKITVIRVTKTVAEKGYDIVELAYKTDEDKTKGMKIFAFGAQKEVGAVAAAAKQGDVLEAEFEQNAKGYWQFRKLSNTGEKAQASAGSVSAGPTGSVAGSTTSKGNWETSEERAARQVMIVRQSSLSTAVALKPKASVEEVIEVAKSFEAYVFGKPQQIKQTGEVQ